MKTCPVCDTPYPDQHATCPTDGAVLLVSLELAAGHIVRGKYRILRKLGQGGMGIVYLAEHLLLGGQLALKFLAPELSRNPQFVKRFRNEARVAYQLRHPNIVEVADLDQDENGVLFIAMEFVSGPSLRTMLRELKGPLPVARAVQIARGVASGLVAAHARNAVHRDIKPENILLGTAENGEVQPKVLDFGIAAMTENITNLSRTHGLLLTPEYASPEQWRGTPADQLDGRTDLYALGGVFYEMLAGQTPYRAVNPEGWMFQHLQGVPEPVDFLRPAVESEFPGLGAIVMRLLSREREQRFDSAAALIEALTPKPAVVHSAPAQAFVQPQPSQPVIEPPSAPLAPVPEARPSPQSPVKPPPLEPVRPAFGVSPELQQPTTQPPAQLDVHGASRKPKASLQSVPTLMPTASPKSTPKGQPSRPPDLMIWGAMGLVVCFGLWVALRGDKATSKPDAPVFNPAGGKFNKPLSVSLSDAVLDAQIHYTLDGSEPTTSSAVYFSPISIHEDVTILRAIAISQDGGRSEEVTGVYRIDYSGIAQPRVSPQSATGVGRIGEKLFGEGKFSQARPALQQDCDSGALDACNDLGWLFDNGQGGARGFNSAQRLYQTACNGGNPTGCNNLGWLFEHGEGIAKDYTRASELYLGACNAGEMSGCKNLAWLLDHGEGVSENPASARTYYQKACDGGIAKACTNLGAMAEEGRGGVRDFSLALKSYTLGCDGGEPTGCSNLGALYADGVGVSQNSVRARELFQKACAAGYKPACDAAQNLR